MGKLIFVNTNRTNGIVGVVLCSALALGGGYATVNGAYWGLLAVLLGLACGKYSLRIATQKTEIYEQGFSAKNIFGQLSGRYADQKSVGRSAISRNGVLTTTIIFIAPSGKKFMVSDEALGGKDNKMLKLLDLACAALAEKWAKTLEQNTEVVWLEKGSSPLLRIRKDGITIGDGTGPDGFIPLNQVRYKEVFGLKVDILNGDRKVLTAHTSTPNFFVGQTLIANLLKKQSQAYAATRG